MPRVVLEDVHKKFGRAQEAVQGVSFTCNDGEFLVLLGPSGCGKTTTLRMICGLESITSGTIWIGDRVVNNLHPRQRNVAMAFETFALYPPLTAYENIAFPLRVMKRSKEEVDQQVRKVAAALSITECLDRLPETLSNGQKQRVALARALVREPSVFLMDEPCSHIDAALRPRARAEIKHLQAVLGATVIYVTHDQIEAVAMADRVVVMDQGVIQQIGTPLDLFYRPANLFVAGFIGEPAMNIVKTRVQFAGGKLILFGFGETDKALKFTSGNLSASALNALGKYEGREIVMGIRPQRLGIAAPTAADGDGTLPGQLLVHEFLGDDGVAEVAVNGTRLEAVTLPEIPFRAGEAITLSVGFQDLHFFDIETTRRIEF